MVFVRMYLKHLTCHFNAYLQAPICRSCLQLASHRNDWSLLLRRQTNTCEIPFFNERCMEWNWNQLYIRKLYILGVAPCPVTVSTRTIIYFVGDPNLNLHLPLASLWTHIYSSSLKTMTIPKMPPHLWSPGSKLFPFFFTQKKVRPFHLISNLAEHLLLLRGFWGQMIFSSKWKQQIHKKSAQVRNALGDSWFQIPEIPATSLSDSSSPSSFGRMGRLWDCSSGLEMSGCIIYFQLKSSEQFYQPKCVWFGREGLWYRFQKLGMSTNVGMWSSCSPLLLQWVSTCASFPPGRLQKMSEDTSAERQPQEITLTRAKWTRLAALSVSSHTKSLSMSYGHAVKQANWRKKIYEQPVIINYELFKKMLFFLIHGNFAIRKFLRASMSTWVSTSLAAKSLRHSSLLASFGSWSRSWVTAAAV